MSSAGLEVAPLLTYVSAIASVVTTIEAIDSFCLDVPMQHHSSFRSLARLCQVQASLANDDRTRRVLEEMASEYSRKADHEEAFGRADHGPDYHLKKLG
jgi:hypothetical protein